MKHLTLEYSFSQKIFFLLRTTNPTLSKSFVSKFTGTKRRVFSSGPGRSASGQAWRQCSLPTSLGGLGYGSSALASLVASTASTYDSKDELPSLLQVGLVRPQSVKKTHRDSRRSTYIYPSC